MKQKNLASIALGVLIIVIFLGAVGYFAFVKKSEPTIQKPIPTLTPISTQLPNKQTPASSLGDETTDWKTYRNEEYGFEFKYPRNIVEIKENNNLETFWKEEDYLILISNPALKYNNYRPEFSVRILTISNESFEKWLYFELPEAPIDSLVQEKFKIGNLDVLQILNNTTPGYHPPDIIYHNFINRGNIVIDLNIRSITSSFGKEFPDKEIQKILSTFKFTK